MATPAPAAKPKKKNPYSEAHHWNNSRPGLGLGAQVPAGPARINQRKKVGEIEKANAILQKKLAALRKEPPSKFHAPDGKASLKKKKAAEDGADDGVVRTWPPPRAVSGKVRHKAEQAAIKEGNATLQKALSDQYKADRDSQLITEGKGKPVDGLQKWEKRLKLYDAEPAKIKNDTGVPKTLGVARCSATGLYTYFAADGHKLKEHEDCPGLYYCEEWFDDMVEMDAASQKAMVDYAKGNGWHPARPKEDCWVVNRHMKLGLDLMRKMAKGLSDMSFDDIKAAIEKCKEEEKMEEEEEAAKQKELEGGGGDQ